jgi:hypothetical protein
MCRFGTRDRDAGMAGDNDWDGGRAARAFTSGGVSILRLTLLFGSAAVAFALILTPMADNFSRSRESPFGIDTMQTGSIGRETSYTIRKSVLQPSPSSICVIRSDGQRVGDC